MFWAIRSSGVGEGGGSLQTSTDLFCIATKFRGREGLAWRAQRGADERTCSPRLLKQLVKATQPVTSLFQVHLLSASNNNFSKQYLLLGKEYSGLREGEKINILFFGFSKHNFFAWNIDVKKLASKFFIDFVNAVFAPLSCFFSSQQRSHPGVVWHNTSYYLLSQRPPSKSPLPQYGAPMMPQAPLLATLCLFKAFLWTIAK